MNNIEEKTVEEVLDDQKKVPMVKAQSTGQIKLKDKSGRGGIKINLQETFKFYPDEIVVQKVQGRNNVIIISAIVPERVLLKEAKKK